VKKMSPVLVCLVLLFGPSLSVMAQSTETIGAGPANQGCTTTSNNPCFASIFDGTTSEGFADIYLVRKQTEVSRMAPSSGTSTTLSSGLPTTSPGPGRVMYFCLAEHRQAPSGTLPTTEITPWRFLMALRSVGTCTS